MSVNTRHASEAESMTMIRETNPDRALREQEVAEWLGLSIATLRAWRRRGQGPRFVKFGRAVRYMVGDVEQFVRASAVDPSPCSASVDKSSASQSPS